MNKTIVALITSAMLWNDCASVKNVVEPPVQQELRVQECIKADALTHIIEAMKNKYPSKECIHIYNNSNQIVATQAKAYTADFIFNTENIQQDTRSQVTVFDVTQDGEFNAKDVVRFEAKWYDLSGKKPTHRSKMFEYIHTTNNSLEAIKIYYCN